MKEEDYHKLGLKAGLEIHQQLWTDKKLFCRCPAGHYSLEFNAEILRHMRPTLSELGEYDGTALMEFKTKKEIIYQINHQTVCTYEMDDTPPFEINQQALDIALEVALLLNYKLVSEIHIARKQYLDGSIPTGFQRTTIVGVDGWVPYQNRKINLIQLGLEEDACREVSDVGHQRIYRTDRLGMPLIEMVTYPEMRTPQEVAEVGNILRWLARSTGKVRTGIGAARQDVNVSITGGTRVEIKGVPRIPLIPLLIYNEAMRQHNLLLIKEELKKRGITEKTFKTNWQDVTQILSETSWDPIRRALKRGERVHCVNLKGYKQILSHTTQTGKVFSKEISDRVRVVACLTRLPNILTSENPEETIGSYTWKKIYSAVIAEPKDSQILVWGDEQDVATGVQEIIIRAREALIGVPSETRQALADGTNGFERILPGPNRMYPDTDLPPLEISSDRIQRLNKNLPRPLWEREKIYRQAFLPEHLIRQIIKSYQAKLFDDLLGRYKIQPVKIAGLLFEKTKRWKRQNLPVEKIKEEDWHLFFDYTVRQPGILENSDKIFSEYLVNPDSKLSGILNKFVPPAVQEKDLFLLIAKVIDDEIMTIGDENKRHRFIMGKMMVPCRGHIPGKKVSMVVWHCLRERRKK